MKTFQAVASLLNFSKAADALNYAQSSVSSHIKSLENDLNTELFHRQGSRIALTQPGIKLLQYAQKLIDLEKEIKTKISGMENPLGSVSIKAPQSVSIYSLPPIIKDFIMMFPKVSLDIDWCIHYSLNEAFRADITDLAFLITDRFSDPELMTEDLGPFPLSWIANPANPLARRPVFSIRDLKDQILLMPKSDCSYELNVRRALLENQLEPKMKIDINSLEALKQIIVTGEGVTLIPDMAIREEVAAGRLAVLNWEKPDFHTRLFLIWKKDKFLPPPVDAFIVMVKSVLGA